MTLLLIGLGGFLGSILRYLLGSAAARAIAPSTIPIGTFVVNALGCLLIGFVIGLAELDDRMDDRLRLFLVVGLLGGFTTFSTFGFETWKLFRDARGALALLNIGGQITVGLAGVWIGFFLARLVAPRS